MFCFGFVVVVLVFFKELAYTDSLIQVSVLYISVLDSVKSAMNI